MKKENVYGCNFRIKNNVEKYDDCNILKKEEILIEIHNENFEKKVDKDYFLTIFSNAQYTTYIIRDTDRKEITGYIIFYDTSDSIDLFEIAVKRKYHSEGIGTELLSKSTEFLFSEKKDLEKKSGKILLEVNEKNEKALNFYKKNGFNRISIRKNYYGLNRNGIIMEKIVQSKSKKEEK